MAALAEPERSSSRNRKVAVFLLAAALLAFALRTLGLGNTFQSNDNAELAARILMQPGYGWSFTEPYGALIGVWVKLVVGCISLLGVTITEFWWKLPIALVGTLQVPLTYVFLKRLKSGDFGALAGAAVMAVLPLHVMQSRYLWGYEVLGVFFVTIALMSLLEFLENPTRRTGLAASFLCGVYLISHGYVMPFAVCLVALLCLYAPKEGDPPHVRLAAGVRLGVRRLLWVYPAAFIFTIAHPIAHAMRKPARFGFYVLDHGPGFIANVGLALALMLLAALALAAFTRRGRSRGALLLAVSGAGYLAPLFLLAPPGVTVVRGYMLVGTYFLVLAAVLVLDALARTRRRPMTVLMSLCVALTLWGTAESIFGRDALLDPTLVRCERGALPPDCGSKAAGYLVRRHVPADAVMLAIHRAVEPPNLYYYFGRWEVAFYDLNLERLRGKFKAWERKADIVVCEPEQAEMVEAAGRFERKVAIRSEGEPRLLIYARAGIDFPRAQADVEELNAAFDREFAPTPRPW